MKVVAIIPARGQSKGISRKNLVHVLGKPLMNWSVEAALQSEFISEVVVSSDDDEILNNAKKYKNVILIKRPKELARDNSPTEPVLIHALEALKNQDKEFKYIILLQATSPLRTAQNIDAAFEKLLKSEANSLISVSEPAHHPLKSFTINSKGYLKGLINNQFPFMPRQELPKVYQANGAIYIAEIEEFLKTKKLFTEKTIHYIMPKNQSIDIDSEEDIKELENLLKK